MIVFFSVGISQLSKEVQRGLWKNYETVCPFFYQNS